MPRNLLVAASALALFAVPALAQTTSPGTSPPPRSSATGTTAPAGAPSSKVDPLKQEDVSQIQGATVYGSDDKKIGSVSTVLMKPDSKTIDRLVVGAGGVLGVGAHDVALPLDQFHWDANQGGFKIAKTEDELKKMPQWKSASSANGASGSGSTAAPPSGSRPATAPPSTR